MGAEVPFVANRRLLVEEDRRCDIPACNCGGSHRVRREPFDWEVMDAALPLVRKVLFDYDGQRVYEAAQDAADSWKPTDPDSHVGAITYATIIAVLRVIEAAAKGEKP